MSKQRVTLSFQDFIKTVGGIVAFLASVATILALPECRQVLALDPTRTLLPTSTAMPQSIPSPVQNFEIPTVLTPTKTPLPVQNFDFPTAAIPTETARPNLIFSDSFDNGISNYWQAIGSWVTVNGQPVLVEAQNPSSYSSPFAWGEGGLILPGVSEFDNYVIEFDFYEGFTAILFSYMDNDNYKSWRISNKGDDFFIEPVCQLLFTSHGQTITIPQSEVLLYYGFQNHIRIEIRENSLALYLNQIAIYDYQGLPDSLIGSIGIVGSESKPVFDNISIYQLPKK